MRRKRKRDEAVVINAFVRCLVFLDVVELAQHVLRTCVVLLQCRSIGWGETNITKPRMERIPIWYISVGGVLSTNRYVSANVVTSLRIIVA